ncbi:exocyst complex component Sec6 [Xylona heveae TC161]|uniref:Exocyst complex component Sec6 n=1 Tax=Xylona heveae (strain CBS 132557 / TC161) TaxID=1328760 RepID=A0A165A586_XYLHT|nr:exocyst complex component Sec6 [Xylona heveae TC161]KZF19967.1 exocyst complex component Sec6 [Xylona heveae TC161]
MKQSSITMIDEDGVIFKLDELLRHPEDLDKLSALRADFMRKKAAVDTQLKLGLKEQLDTTQMGIDSINDGKRTVNSIKEEMMKIDKLCAESQNMIRDFPNINLVSQTHRNFTQVEAMKENLDTFNDKLQNLKDLLKDDDEDIENQPNLLAIHYGLTKLRDIRDDAMNQIKRASDKSLEATLQEYFSRLDDVIEWFDDHVGTACMNLIPLVQADNKGMVVRLALVIEEEERSDKKVAALQDAQRDHKELASRFKSMATGPKELRGYKEKFLQSIELHAQSQFEETEATFLEDSSKLDKCTRWFFNDLYVVKIGMVGLMPKRWNIMKTYVDIYHHLMHDWLVKLIDDPNLKPANMLAIIHWGEKYYAKLERLGFQESDVQPQLIDNREGELVREWRQLIIKYLDEWIDRMFAGDRKVFLERKPDCLDTDENGYFRTKTLGDMWRMLREQVTAAGNSERADVTEGVIDAMFLTLKHRQTMWQKVMDEEASKYTGGQGEQEGLQILQDWLVAISNDQIACIDDNEETGQLGYLSRFKRDFEPLVTPKYMLHASSQIEGLRDGYVDLATHCVTIFVSIVFAVDLRSTISDFFTPKWYSEYGMKRITSTFDDYISDYSEVLHHSMVDIFVEELSEELLIRYLSGVRNKGAKFRRVDAFNDKFKDDVITAFQFFERFPDFANIKQKWRVVDGLVRLLEAEKHAVASVYESFKQEYWDVQLSWVEAVLRSRDDFDRGMMNSVKTKAAEMHVERGPETIMSKVR